MSTDLHRPSADQSSVGSESLGRPASNKRTADQIEKKREQDRNSQRNVRQRTRQYIATLEARLDELSSPDVVAQLLKSNEALQKRNDELTAIIRTVSDFAAQSVLSNPGGTSTHPPPPVQDRRHSSHESLADTGVSTTPDRGYPNTPNTNKHSHRNDSITSLQSPHSVASGATVELPNNTENLQCDAHNSAQSSGLNDFHHGSGSEAANHEPNTPDLNEDSNPNHFHRHQAACTNYPNSVDSSCMFVSQICAPTNRWDRKMAAFISIRQSALLSQLDPSAYEPSNPDVKLLLYPGENNSTPDAITHFLAAVVNQWGFAMAERLGIFWLNYVYLKSQIAPTTSNARHLPEWFTPRAAQCLESHPAYIDTLPWPRMRDKLTMTYSTFDWDPFLFSFCSTLNVNWKGDDSALYVSQPDGSLTVSPLFETHLRKLESWSLKEPFAQTYPHLATEANIY